MKKLFFKILTNTMDIEKNQELANTTFYPLDKPLPLMSYFFFHSFHFVGKYMLLYIVSLYHFLNTILQNQETYIHF